MRNLEPTSHTNELPEINESSLFPNSVSDLSHTNDGGDNANADNRMDSSKFKF